MTAPAILALDLSTKTGVAEGRAGDTPRLYSINFGRKHDEHEDVFGRALDWFSIRLTEMNPDAVYIEAPINPAILGERGGDGKQRSHPATIIRLIGLWATISAECKSRGFLYRKTAPSTVRAQFLGDGRLKKDEAKRRAFAMCKSLNWIAPDQDASDAGALWWYAVSRFAPALSVQITPMMWGACATTIRGVDVGGADALFKRVSA